MLSVAIHTGRTSNRGFSTSQIIAALESLGISFAIHNRREITGLRFCSFMAPEDNGVYFLEGNRFTASPIADSVVVCSTCIPDTSICSLIVKQPQVTFYRLMSYFFATTGYLQGVHETAIVSSHAHISPSAWIGPYCVIGAAEIKADTRLISHVVVYDGSIIEDNVVIEAHSTIGATGVAWVWDDTTGQRTIQPQIGGVHIGKHCFIGTDVTFARGSVNELTRLGEGSMIAHGSKIGHGAVIGNNVHFANNVSIGGNARISDRCFLGSGCIVTPGVTLSSGVTVGAGAVVTKRVDQPDAVICGVPAKPVPMKDKHSGVPKRLCNHGEYDI